MYLIHFIVKIILKCFFPKVDVFKGSKFKPTTSIHYPSQRGEINCVDISKEFTTASLMYILKKYIIIYYS